MCPSLGWEHNILDGSFAHPTPACRACRPQRCVGSYRSPLNKQSLANTALKECRLCIVSGELNIRGKATYFHSIKKIRTRPPGTCHSVGKRCGGDIKRRKNYQDHMSRKQATAPLKRESVRVCLFHMRLQESWQRLSPGK